MNIIFSPKQSEEFAVIINLFEKLTDSVNLMFNREKLTIQSMDNSHVMFFEISLTHDWFEKYSCEQSMVLGVHTKRINAILTPRKKNQGMQWESAPDEGAVNITYHAVDNSNKMEFQMGLVDLDQDTNTIPPYIEIAAIVIKSSIFHEIISDMLKWGGSSLKIECCEESIQCTTFHSELGDKMTVEMKIDDLEEFSINESESLTVQYQLKFLSLAANSLQKLQPTLQLFLHNEMPLKIHCQLGTNPLNFCTLYITGLVAEED
jgi:proliferating cell nuclear antigen PCNA